MLNDIFSFLKSLVSVPKQETAEEFIEKFARATPLTFEEVDRMKDDLRLTTPKAVHATLLVHVYGIHLALLGTAARKLIQHADRAAFETSILSRYIDASLKKLGVAGNAHGLYQEMSHQMKEMDAEFYANTNDTNGPFFAVTKRFLRITCGKDSTDIAVMLGIAGSIGNHMKSTAGMFDGLYENGYRF